ncbi:hypothetical protein ACUNWD_05105 [Sunxiuqinia sp. A32]|uniref:hypothetical protein n=1 Tax=Sunxiuqinia sp. A32 TaxID=3461496 RepID=UPI00404582ED
MRLIIFISLLTFSVMLQAQTITQQEKDQCNSYNKTILTLQRQRVSNLVAFMRSHNIQSIGYNQTNQNYIKLLPGMYFTRRQKYPGVTIKKHPNFPSAEQGAYVVGVLKGNMPYKNLTFNVPVTGHTFAMFLSNSGSLKSTGHTDLEMDGNAYILPTSLCLFYLPHQFKPGTRDYVDYQSTIVIPLAQIQKLSDSDRKEFHRLFYDLNGGLK